MGKLKRNTNSKIVPKTRKEFRKDKRLQKKVNKQSYFSNKNTKKNETKEIHKPTSTTTLKEDDEFVDDDEIESDFELSDNELNNQINKLSKTKAQNIIKSKPKNLIQAPNDRFFEIQQREKKKQKELEKKMRKRRINQLTEANEEENKIIRKLEKKLKIDKHRNEKSVHKMFSDGLDYAMELCLPQNIEKMYSVAKEAAELDNESVDEFKEDMDIALGKNKSKELHLGNDSTINNKIVEKNIKVRQKKLKEIESKYFKKNDLESDLSGSDSELNDSDYSEEGSEKGINSDNSDLDTSDADSSDEELSANNIGSDDGSIDEKNELDDLVDNIGESENSDYSTEEKLSKNNPKNADVDSECSNDESLNESNDIIDKKSWEDIYGRKRDADGNIFEDNKQKYIPPHVRARLEKEETGSDSKRKERLRKLKRQCKGFLNRLSEANMIKISSEIENLYMNNPRFDMNNTLSELVMEALISNVLSKERMVLEHTMIIAILHTNVGSEVGAHVLQTLINRFDGLIKNIENLEVEDKELDNIIFVISHLYTYKIFHHTLIFEIIKNLIGKLCEKSVECILLILKSVGFQLRKDDPSALKDIILTVQRQANEMTVSIKENPRFKFMIETLTAIKNNNMHKIPQYDPTLAEHLKKILKSICTNGKYLSTLNITMDDLLNADEKGKWWVVGSAWTGNIKDINSASKIQDSQLRGEKFSEKLLNLAKAQRMNTEDRRNVFCIIMSAEDYVDAFERLLHLALKDQRIIASIIIQCCLSEKIFNPYYAVLAQKFCEYDRKYQLAVQFAAWDRIKDIQSSNNQQIANFAQFLTFLIIHGAQPISVLKVIDFTELDKTTLRFVRKIILGILLSNENEFEQVFKRIVPSTKLLQFKNSIMLFMRHFLLKGSTKTDVQNDKMDLLKKRINEAETTLYSTRCI